ncbi:MAG TPA: c-type cytochrome [Flavobacterium sp.]|nr:c-type cytochrome [Flavobacterium sp.]
MKTLSFFIGILLIISACSNPKKDMDQDFMLKYNSKQLEKAGQVLYSKFCLECHSSKGARDNFLMENIQKDHYDWDFLIAYINHQDRLLQQENKRAMKLKEEYSNIDYLHQFHLTEQEIKSIVYYLKQQ